MTQDKDSRNGVWVTPREFFEPLREEFGLEVDSAASADNAMLAEFWDESVDGLRQDWTGRRVWCNPPYGRGIGVWVEKCATGGAEVCVALLPARTDTRWFHDYIYGNPGAEVRFVRGRIRFSGMKGGGKFPSMVVIFRKPPSVTKVVF